MVYRTKHGLGSREAAVSEFDRLLPHVLIIRSMQGRCAPMGPDDFALGIAVDGLETAAYHFTGRRHYFETTRVQRQFGQNYFAGLGDQRAASAAFDQLRPYWKALRDLQDRCAPFGRDYLALAIATQSLETAAYHFTRLAAFYGDKGDSAGTSRRTS